MQLLMYIYMVNNEDISLAVVMVRIDYYLVELILCVSVRLWRY
jgi:hypothetical protein